MVMTDALIDDVTRKHGEAVCSQIILDLFAKFVDDDLHLHVTSNLYRLLESNQIVMRYSDEFRTVAQSPFKPQQVIDFYRQTVLAELIALSAQADNQQQ